MGRKKEIVEVDGLAVEAPGVDLIWKTRHRRKSLTAGKRGRILKWNLAEKSPEIWLMIQAISGKMLW